MFLQPNKSRKSRIKYKKLLKLKCFYIVWGVKVLEIKKMQEEVDSWIGQFEEGYWHPLTLLATLTEEVGELAREVNHLYGEKTKKPQEPAGDIALELADILFIIICYANSLNIDLEDAFKRMMEKYRLRDSHRWVKKEGT